MRVFPLLDLQVAEFANQKARPGAGLHVQFRAAADASPNTAPTRTSRRSTTSACSSSRYDALCADERCRVAIQTHKLDVDQRRYGEGMDDPETV